MQSSSPCQDTSGHALFREAQGAGAESDGSLTWSYVLGLTPFPGRGVFARDEAWRRRLCQL